MDHQFILRDTFDYLNRVFEVQLTNNDHLISFGIESSFTNILTDRRIKIILNKIFTTQEPDKIRNGTPGKPAYPDRSLFHKFNGLTRHELKQILILCKKSSHFVFNNKF